MAHLQVDARNYRFLIRFRYAGVEYKRSLKTLDDREAETIRSRVEETIRLLERGRLELPANGDVAAFILSDGKRVVKPIAKRSLSLGDLFRLYRETLPPGAKEATTIEGEDRHIGHLKRIIGSSRRIQSLTVADLQRYADSRSREKWHGRLIRPDTVRKELTTFRLIWNWAVERGELSSRAPIKGVRLAKPDEKPPFMTFGEIKNVIVRGGLTEEERKAIWASLFLDASQVSELLDHVERTARHPFVYPMFAFVAHTGARRSEILRARVEDFDLSGRVVRIREKKKSRTKAVTYRHVDLTPRLAETMRRWFTEHPGGPCVLAQPIRVENGLSRYSPLTTHESVHHFRAALAGSDWSVVRGFHVFRHSFASNAAAAGVDQRVIDEWMGHQTEEMRRRYRHLFPEQRRKAIESIFCVRCRLWRELTSNSAGKISGQWQQTFVPKPLQFLVRDPP
ncbi:MAG: site-specific integrase, partial [Planctomycetota bacterium]|nr:site-specific integrase [Planctomycetota bacterium]